MKPIAPPANPLKGDTLELSDGRTLTEGVEFTIHGGGRYSFRYRYGNDAVCWGPVGKSDAKTRYFRPDHINTIHRKTIQRES